MCSSDLGNQHNPTVLISPIKSKVTKKVDIPTHCKITADFLDKEAMVLLEQIRNIDKQRLGNYLGRATLQQMNSFGKAIKISTGLINPIKGDRKNDRYKKY